MGTSTESVVAPAASSTSARTEYMYVLSVFHNETVDEMEMAGVRRVQPPAARDTAVRLVATVAPSASSTVMDSVALTATARALATSTTALISAEAAVCGPIAPSGPLVIAPVTAAGKYAPQGTMESGSAVSIQTWRVILGGGMGGGGKENATPRCRREGGIGNERNERKSTNPPPS